MEDSTDLLEDFVSKENDIYEYRSSYRVYRKAAVFLFCISTLLFLLFINEGKPSEEGAGFTVGYVIGTLIGGGLGIGLIAIVPAAVFASVFAALMNREYSYKERFRKMCWMFLFGMTGLITLCFGMVALQQQFEPGQRSLF